jgi:hypothetical protein
MAVTKFLDSSGNVAWADEFGNPITEHGLLEAALKRNNNEINDHTAPTPLGAENQRRREAGEAPAAIRTPREVALVGSGSGSRGQFPQSATSALAATDKKSDGDGGGKEKSNFDKFIEQMQIEREERAKIEANRDSIQTALDDARVRISGLEAGTNAIGAFSRNPGSMMTSMFVDPANAGQLVPVTPSMSSLLRQQGLQPTALGAMANSPLEGITPEQINPDLFRDIIRGMTNRDVGRAGNNPGVLSQIIAMGQLAGINAPAALQARMAQTPTQSSIEGSLFKTGLI